MEQLSQPSSLNSKPISLALVVEPCRCFAEDLKFFQALTAQKVKLQTPHTFFEAVVVNCARSVIMASRICSRSLRVPLARQFASPAYQRRTFVLALGGLKAGIVAPTRPIVGAALKQTRGVKTIDFAGHKEKVYGSSELLAKRSYGGLTVTQSVRIGQGKSFW